MPTFTLTEASPSPAADIAEPPPLVPSDPTFSHGDGAVQSVVGRLRQELDHIYGQLRGFRDDDPAQVLLEISGYSARLIGMRAQLMRSSGRHFDKFRTTEVDPLLSQLEFQFKIFSRLITVSDLDFRLSGGQT